MNNDKNKVTDKASEIGDDPKRHLETREGVVIVQRVDDAVPHPYRRTGSQDAAHSDPSGPEGALASFSHERRRQPVSQREEPGDRSEVVEGNNRETV